MKLFVVSDIHGHATELEAALAEAGFDPENAEHLFVCCGDCFDRGHENRRVLTYLDRLPNKILLRGNHEDMLEDALLRGYVTANNAHNGTVTTIQEFCGRGGIDSEGWITASAGKTRPLEDFTEQMADYFETEHFVFVHGWLPLKRQYGMYTLREDWRYATWKEWREARWVEWQNAYEGGLTLADRTIVCGHRTVEYGCMFDRNRPKKLSTPFFGERLIAIDACTVVSGRVNVLVLEEEVLMTCHSMTLRREYFDAMESGRKTVEMRLLDEKRRKLRVGDRIEFFCEGKEGARLETQVLGLYGYPGFYKLAEDFEARSLGFEGKSPAEIDMYMTSLYGAEAIRQNQALAIKVRRIGR